MVYKILSIYSNLRAVVIMLGFPDNVLSMEGAPRGGSSRGSLGGHTLVGGGAHTLVGGHSDFGSICEANSLRGVGGGHVPPSPPPPPGSAPGTPLNKILDPPLSLAKRRTGMASRFSDIKK